MHADVFSPAQLAVAPNLVANPVLATASYSVQGRLVEAHSLSDSATACYLEAEMPMSGSWATPMSLPVASPLGPNFEVGPVHLNGEDVSTSSTELTLAIWGLPPALCHPGERPPRGGASHRFAHGRKPG